MRTCAIYEGMTLSTVALTSLKGSLLIRADAMVERILPCHLGTWSGTDVMEERSRQMRLANVFTG